MHSPTASRALSVALLATVLLGAGCGRTDSRSNSDPIPSQHSASEGGDAAVKVDPNRAQPAGTGTSPGTGTDSTGRLSDGSGGTTQAGSGSGTSGTQTGTPRGADAK